MPDPSELLAVARFLSRPDPLVSLTDAHLRRAVSTAYYAVFHKLSHWAASRFMGAGRETEAGYALLYRAFNHTDMARTFEALGRSTLSEKYRKHLGRVALSQYMRDFAGAFLVLQASRHRADYDPGVTFLPFDVAGVIEVAESAIEAFDRVPDAERTDVLALLLAGSRS